MVIVDRQTPEYNRFRAMDVRVGKTEVLGGPQRLDGINTLCATVPDVQTATTVYELICSPGPIEGELFDGKVKRGLCISA